MHPTSSGTCAYLSYLFLIEFLEKKGRHCYCNMVYPDKLKNVNMEKFSRATKCYSLHWKCCFARLTQHVSPEKLRSLKVLRLKSRLTRVIGLIVKYFRLQVPVLY